MGQGKGKSRDHGYRHGRIQAGIPKRMEKSFVLKQLEIVREAHVIRVTEQCVALQAEMESHTDGD